MDLYVHLGTASILIRIHLISFYTTILFLTCSENAGLLALTRVGSRRVVQISAGFMIFFSILGKYVTCESYNFFLEI